MSQVPFQYSPSVCAGALVYQLQIIKYSSRFFLSFDSLYCRKTLLLCLIGESRSSLVTVQHGAFNTEILGNAVLNIYGRAWMLRLRILITICIDSPNRCSQKVLTCLCLFSTRRVLFLTSQLFIDSRNEESTPAISKMLFGFCR